MKLVGVCACTSGIAHTYMAKEKLVKAALGHEIHVETQGTIGVEDPLTPEEIAEADAVILAVDIKVEKGRFEGKPTLEIPTSLVVKAPKQVIQKVAESIGK